LLDNQQTEAKRRFDALSALFDLSTFRHLDQVGIAPGWRCWEVGAGGPTVAAWIAQRVGPAGYVLATDVDTWWITDPGPAAFEVRHHDAGEDERPGGGFDLIEPRTVSGWPSPRGCRQG
jgi:hypothetical protein